MSKLVADVETITSKRSSLESFVNNFSSAISSFNSASISCTLDDVNNILNNYRDSISDKLKTLNTSSNDYNTLVKDCCDMYEKNEEIIIPIDLANIISVCRRNTGTIFTRFDEIDWNSKYFTYGSRQDGGNPSVADPNNPGWPFNGDGLSSTGAYNRLICNSYAAGRFWQNSAPDDNFPLQEDWDNILHYGGELNSTSQATLVRTNDSSYNPPPGSIIGIAYNDAYDTRHDAYIEGYTEDGQIIITESNIGGQGNEFGWRSGVYESLDDWMINYHNPNSSVVGFIEP